MNKELEISFNGFRVIIQSIAEEYGFKSSSVSMQIIDEKSAIHHTKSLNAPPEGARVTQKESKTIFSKIVYGVYSEGVMDWQYSDKKETLIETFKANCSLIGK